MTVTNSITERFIKQYEFVRDAYITAYKLKSTKERDDKEPNWYHCARVAQSLEFMLDSCGERTPEERRNIVLGAFGHDLIEDVNVTEDKIKELFGETPLEYIKGMTRKGNDFDVKDYKAYSQKIVNSSEEVRLIKLADLLDNYATPAYRSTYIPYDVAKRIDFLENKLIPILDMQYEAVKSTKFEKYKETAARFLQQIEHVREILSGELQRRKNDEYLTTAKFA